MVDLDTHHLTCLQILRATAPTTANIGKAPAANTTETFPTRAQWPTEVCVTPIATLLSIHNT